MTNPRTSNRWRSLFAALTVLTDAIVIALALAVGYAINFGQFTLHAFLQHQWKLLAYCLVLYQGIGATSGLYRHAYSTPLRVQLSASIRAFLLGTLIAFATLFLVRNTYYSHGAVLTFIVLLPLSFIVGRILLEAIRQWMYRTRRGMDATIIVLLHSGAMKTFEQLLTYPLMRFAVRSVVDVSHLDPNARNLAIEHAIAAHSPSTIIIGCLSLDGNSIVWPELGAQLREVRLVSTEVHDALSRMRLYDYAGIRPAPRHGGHVNVLRAKFKRFLDILLGGMLLVIAAPVALLIAVAIKLESEGSVLFQQMRSLSPGSKPLRVLKFRSMKDNGNGMVSPVDSEGGSNQLLKKPDDPRITRVGRILRRYSLDEIPQLLNVLAGDMSLVGPRPLPTEHFAVMPLNAATRFLVEQRAAARPGMTGLWQISGRSGLTFQQMVILDLYYAEHQSLLFDLEILLETIPTVISGRGAY